MGTLTSTLEQIVLELEAGDVEGARLIEFAEKLRERTKAKAEIVLDTDGFGRTFRRDSRPARAGAIYGSVLELIKLLESGQREKVLNGARQCLARLAG